jgi:hypothetical protein
LAAAAESCRALPDEPERQQDDRPDDRSCVRPRSKGPSRSTGPRGFQPLHLGERVRYDKPGDGPARNPRTRAPLTKGSQLCMSGIRSRVVEGRYTRCSARSRIARWHSRASACRTSGDLPWLSGKGEWKSPQLAEPPTGGRTQTGLARHVGAE